MLIVSFEGWNDAGEAASGAAKVIARSLNADVVASVDPEDYYDFQFTRPTVSYDADGSRTLDWPGTEMCIPAAEAIERLGEFSAIIDARTHELEGQLREQFCEERERRDAACQRPR